jgi:hypothetical protein
VSVDPNVLAIYPSQPLKSSPERCDLGLRFRIALSIAHQHANQPHPARLLRARRERPSGSRAEERYELASPHWPRSSLTIAVNPALNLTDYSREMRAVEWVSMASLRSSNDEPDMSA